MVEGGGGGVVGCGGVCVTWWVCRGVWWGGGMGGCGVFTVGVGWGGGGGVSTRLPVSESDMLN